MLKQLSQLRREVVIAFSCKKKFGALPIGAASLGGSCAFDVNEMVDRRHGSNDQMNGDTANQREYKQN